MKDFDMLDAIYNEEVLGLKNPIMEVKISKNDVEKLKSVKEKASTKRKVDLMDAKVNSLKEKKVKDGMKFTYKGDKCEVVSAGPEKSSVVVLKDKKALILKNSVILGTDKKSIDEACSTTKKKPKPPVKKKAVTNEEVYTESALAESIKMGNYESIMQELIDLVKSLGDKGLTQSMSGVSISNGVLADKDLAFLWNRTISNPHKYFKSLINKLKALAKGRQGEKQGEGWVDE